MSERIRMQHITKRFPGVVANDDITLSVEANEVHCLLGENGSGKSTLMNVLFGIHRPDTGEIYLDGKPVSIASSRDACRLGIGMVHQHFMLFNQNTVLENIIIGEERTRLFLRSERQRGELQRLIDQYGFQIDLNEKICNLSVGAKQRVEILKILYRGVHIIIFDEPTAVLTPQESEQLMEIIEQLRQDGKTIVYISHKLNETLRIGDHISVLRKGRLICTLERKDATAEGLALEMVGKPLDTVCLRSERAPGEPLLSLSGVCLRNGKRPCYLTVHENEIVGVAGVDGNGQMELEQLIMGLIPLPSGSIALCGRDVGGASTLERRLSGLAHIPSDRFRYGILPDESLQDNYLLGAFKRAGFSRGGVIQKRRLAAFSSAITEAYDVRAAGAEVLMRTLSGGNQQKAVLARELSHNPRMILAAQPTRGLDIGAIDFIHRLLLKKRDEGCGVLLISAELTEIQTLCDRIAVMFEGEIVAEGPAGQFTQEQLGLLMAGHAGRGAAEREEQADAD